MIVNQNIVILEPKDMAQRHRIDKIGSTENPQILLGGVAEGFVDGDFVEIVRVYGDAGSNNVSITPNTSSASPPTIFAPRGNELTNAGDLIRATYDATNNRWDLDCNILPQPELSYKPQPLTTINVNIVGVDGTFPVGNSAQHNVHYRFNLASEAIVYVANDSSILGSGEWFEDDFNPQNPGPMPVGGSILITRAGDGDVVFEAAPGVTINSPDSLTMGVKFSKVSLIKVGPNEWDIEGNLAPL
jgi:hypothetical protein